MSQQTLKAIKLFIKNEKKTGKWTRRSLAEFLGYTSGGLSYQIGVLIKKGYLKKDKKGNLIVK